METNFWEEPDYQALYEISIAELGLSASAIVSLKEVGVTNVGDCIDYHINKHSVMINASFAYREVMENEVKERLQEYGYWSFYENAMNSNED